MVGVLDAYVTNMWAAFGIKLLVGSYSGALLRVRRISDNAELDVGFTGTGALDTATIVSWCAGSSVCLVKAYDQSGHNNHFGQTTLSYQPQLFNAGVYNGAAQLDGVDDHLASVNLGPTVQALTFALRHTLRALSTGTAVQSLITQDLGVAGMISSGVQQQGGSGNYDSYTFNGASAYQNEAWSGPNTAEKTQVLVADRSLSGGAKLALYEEGAPHSGNVGPSGPGTDTSAHTANSVFVGGINRSGGVVQAAQLNFEWAAVWSSNQAQAAAISAVH